MGILDFLQQPDAQLGIGLLAAAGPTTDPNQTGFGQRLQGVMRGMDAQKQQDLRLKLLQSQMDENASQDLLRKAQIAKLTSDQDFINRLGQRMTGGGGVPAAVDPSAGGLSVGVTPGVPSGLGGVGSPAAAGGGQNSFPLSFGETVMAKLRGHDLMDAYKYANEPQQLQPGSLYRNRMTGQMESIPSVSQNGQASQIVPDPTAPGGYRVIAPNGAVDVYRQYKNVDAGVTSANTPVKVFNPQTMREEYVPQSTVLGGASGAVTPMAGRPGNVQSPGYAGGDRNAANAESIRIMQAELQKPDLTDADRAGIKREIQRMQMQSGLTNTQVAQSGGYAAGPSANEAASTKGREATATSIGNKAGDLLKESADQATGAVQAVQSAQRMQQALDSDKVLAGPTASLRLKGLQIAATLGMPGKDDAEKISNTRQAVQEMAKMTLAGRKQMSGQGAITNQESALAERATSGDIDSLTAPEIRQLANAAERTARFQYEQHQVKLKAMAADPAMAGNVALYQPPPMPDGRPAAPVATLRFNPATGKLEKVQ